MIELEKIFRESLNEIKSKWELPKKGFLTGGSISNIAWEKISGNKAKINDIDIYILDSIIEKEDDKYSAQVNDEIKEKQSYQHKEKIIFEDYQGLNFSFGTSRFYIIDKVTKDGDLNIINYKGTSDDPMLIINSFDINCCQLGYDLESDKFYWTEDFEEFLNTGEIKLTNLCSPSHSAIRLAKKKHDLGAKLDNLELDIISYVLLRKGSFHDVIKHRFKKRYADMFNEYPELRENFLMKREPDVEEFIQIQFNCEDYIWTLTPKTDGLKLDSSKGLVYFVLSREFLYWVRNIYKNPKLEKAWFKLQHIFDTNMKVSQYLDCEISDEDLDLMDRLINIAPKSIINLKGKTLSQQIEIVKKLVDKFKHDPIISISILEKIKIEDNVDLNDDLTLLLLELSVRKEILEDPKDKVRRILEYPLYRVENDNLELLFK